VYAGRVSTASGSGICAMNGELKKGYFAASRD